jgi:hypothetical protein
MLWFELVGSLFFLCTSSFLQWICPFVPKYIYEYLKKLIFKIVKVIKLSYGKCPFEQHHKFAK